MAEDTLPVAGGGQAPERTGRSPGASFWLLFSSRSHRQLPGCFLPWPRSGGEVWVWSAGRMGMEPVLGHRDPALEVGRVALGFGLLCERGATMPASRGIGRAVGKAPRRPGGCGEPGTGRPGAHHLHAVLLHAPAGLEVRADALAGPLLELRELPAAGLDDGLDLLLGLLGDGHHAVQVLVHKETHKHLQETQAVGRAGLAEPPPQPAIPGGRSR